MKKIFLSAVIVAAALFTGYGVYNTQKSVVLSNTLLANVEALADNESEADLDCQDFLGWCEFVCNDCGLKWSAIGSHMVGTHKCSQSK